MDAATRETHARHAFWGSNPLLMHAIEDALGYEMNGRWWPANSVTLAEAIHAVLALTDDEILELQALGILPPDAEAPYV